MRRALAEWAEGQDCSHVARLLAQIAEELFPLAEDIKLEASEQEVSLTARRGESRFGGTLRAGANETDQRALLHQLLQFARR
jgi:hypothetical protein